MEFQVCIEALIVQCVIDFLFATLKLMAVQKDEFVLCWVLRRTTNFDNLFLFSSLLLLLILEGVI